MAPLLPEVKQDRLTDTVYNILRESILRRKFKSGERLHVEELAEQLHVSRTPVRESLNLLAAEGLVDIVQRSGTFVARISPQDIEECFDLRCVLEGLAVERVVEQGLNPKHLERLRELARMADEPGRDDPNLEQDQAIRHAEANRLFHELLIELSGNRKLAQIYRMLNASSMMAFVHYASPEWTRRRALERAEHEAIVSALAQGDAQAARRAVEAHIVRAKSSIMADMRRALADESRGNGEG